MGNTCKTGCSDRATTISLIEDNKKAEILSEAPTSVTTTVKFGSSTTTTKSNKQRKGSGESSSDNDDDYYEPNAFAKFQNQNKNKGPRTSVSAEAYGTFNKKSDWQPKLILKTKDQKARIKAKLEQAFMFQTLEDSEMTIVIDAMEEKQFKVGEWVIKQGDNGDHLYVVDSGELDCTKQYPNDTAPRYLKTYVEGESFGELALLYNAPRAASIKVKAQAILFVLDRETFSFIVKDSAIKKRQQYEDFLAKIELLSSMDSYERSKVAEAVKTVKIKQGEYVVKQGDPGDVFYFLQEGKAIATKIFKQGQPPQTVKNYEPGGYFGELALLKDVPRQANIVAQTDLVLASLDRGSFKRLLGPLEEILKRNTKNYEKFTLQL